MFSGVRGEGIKKFFKNRKGRNLSFASKKQKVQAGYDIDEIAKNAVENNTVNLIVSSLKAMIKDLEIQLSASKNSVLEGRLKWAKEYLSLFEEEVAKIKGTEYTPSSPGTQKTGQKPEQKPGKKPGKKPEQQPGTTQTPEEKKEHELRTHLKSIEVQASRVKENVKKFPFVIVKDKLEEVIDQIDVINGLVMVYENLVNSYKVKGGTEQYPSITVSDSFLKKMYKMLADKIDELKDELQSKPTENYETKNNLMKLETFANDLLKFAPSTEKYIEIRTAVDKERAAARQPKTEDTVTEPLKQSYQEDVDAYENGLRILNAQIIDLNKLIAKIEALAAEKSLTLKLAQDITSLEEQIKHQRALIRTTSTSLESKKIEIKNNHKVEVDKLPNIQNIPREKETYSMEYNGYISALDRKAIEAISRIKEITLSNSKKTQEEAINSHQETAQLYQFLQVVNSLIDARIIQHSKATHEHTDKLYKERHQNRKAIAEEYQIQSSKMVDVVKGENEYQVFKDHLMAVSHTWLLSISKAPISRSGKILVDQTPYITEMTSLIAEANDNEKLKALYEISYEFTKQRTEIIKQKRTALTSFRNIIMNRIKAIFGSGTIAESMNPAVDYNEWLTIDEYKQMLEVTQREEFKETIPNGDKLIAEYIKEQEKRYKSIKEKTHVKEISKLSVEIEQLVSAVEAIPVDEKFEENVTAYLEGMKTRFAVLKDFNYILNIEQNTVSFTYSSATYNYQTGRYTIEQKNTEHKVMSETKLTEYKKAKNPTPRNVQPEDELQKPMIIVEGEEPSQVKVTNRTIKLATNRRQVINRAKNLIIENADSLTVSLIKQGLRIRYNENLRDQLKALNAKLSLVNKANYRSRKDIKFQGEETEQDLAFKTPKENFNIEDYKLEIRLMDEEKKKSDLLYTYDLENISEELHGRTK